MNIFWIYSALLLGLYSHNNSWQPSERGRAESNICMGTHAMCGSHSQPVSDRLLWFPMWMGWWRGLQTNWQRWWRSCPLWVCDALEAQALIWPLQCRHWLQQLEPLLGQVRSLGNVYQKLRRMIENITLVKDYKDIEKHTKWVKSPLWTDVANHDDSENLPIKVFFEFVNHMSLLKAKDRLNETKRKTPT